ncbi:Gfo/Idh/MocA family protein [Saccharopolyspora gloriosae]|uniref:Gfo/Idh/MocA family protein n=1 Tax=Saccharopolyspora gloriosae TaxID=455344 RepID=UPI001FB8226B|nr:Gfo/Idh/MocA family oxidoreductase [Saccharopolyspora gloriosae]
MEPLRIGTLGAARITEHALVSPAAATGDRIVAIAARNRDRAAAFAHEHGVENVLDSYHAVVNSPEVELVYNPLANAFHGPWNLASIRAGKHVLSEKPFASNAAEAREVKDAARCAGVTVLEGFHYLFHPVMRRAHEILASGEIGELTHVQARTLMPAPPDDDPRWDFELAGGSVMDLGCYGLHAHRMLAPFAGGGPVLTDARGAERAGRPGVDEWVEAHFEFPGGATGSSLSSMTHDAFSMTLRLVGSAGELVVADYVQPHKDDRVHISVPAGSRVERLGRRSSYLFQLEALRDHLRNGTAIPIGIDDAVENAELVDDIYRAAGFETRPSRSPTTA